MYGIFNSKDDLIMSTRVILHAQEDAHVELFISEQDALNHAHFLATVHPTELPYYVKRVLFGLIGAPSKREATLQAILSA